MIVEAPQSDSSSDESSSHTFAHLPVMMHEIVDVFASVPPGVVLDATVGGGGHSRALLESRNDIGILAMDRDDDALEASRSNLEEFADRVTFHRGRFDSLSEAMESNDLVTVSGVLFDLGVSSHQFDAAERGFSYRFDAPLDMRMDRRQTTSAADIVNGAAEDELTRILRDFADERFAQRIARAIVAARPIRTTLELAQIVASAIPAPARRRGGHPAKRTFQALRIAVNEELAVLPTALDEAVSRTCRGGRIAVLSYHSGEDRIVKERFAEHASGGCRCPHGLPCVCGARANVRRVRSASRPSDAEKQSNPRSTSARLRVVEVI